MYTAASQNRLIAGRNSNFAQTDSSQARHNQDGLLNSSEGWDSANFSEKPQNPYIDRLNPGNGQYLTSAIVAAGRASAVRATCCTAIAATIELRRVPAVGGLASTQAHLGHFSFRDSHKTRRLRFELQMIQRIPHGPGSLGRKRLFRRQLQSGTVLRAAPVAVRMSGKGEDNVFS